MSWVPFKQDQQGFSIKAQIVTILDFMGHCVSVQLCNSGCHGKADKDYTQMIGDGCVPTNTYLHKQETSRQLTPAVD